MEIVMEKMKMRMVIYLALSVLLYGLLVMCSRSGLGTLVFTLLQLAAAPFIVKNKKHTLYFIPLVVFGVNAFVSANTMWHVTNILASVVILAIMNGGMHFTDTTMEILCGMTEKCTAPLAYFNLPFKWLSEIKNSTVKRIFIACVISVPCVAILLTALSGADMVFGKIVENSFGNILDNINAWWIFKAVFSVAAGFYLFGVMVIQYIPQKEITVKKSERKIDMFILNIVLCSIILTYTLFCVIQFRYLFARGTLPYGLIYSEYARKGFFELAALTGVNVCLIGFSTGSSKKSPGSFTKVLCILLCTATCILLASSYYRMYLYCTENGLTRMRFMVTAFLWFEAVGLLVTFAYIIKPKFNAAAAYLCIALVYYMFLNLVPMDGIVAKSHVDRALSGDNRGLDYILYDLSWDAYPQMKRLLGTEYNDAAKDWIERKRPEEAKDWRQFNLSADRK